MYLFTRIKTLSNLKKTLNVMIISHTSLKHYENDLNQARNFLVNL